MGAGETNVYGRGEIGGHHIQVSAIFNQLIDFVDEISKKQQKNNFLQVLCGLMS